MEGSRDDYGLHAQWNGDTHIIPFISRTCSSAVYSRKGRLTTSLKIRSCSPWDLRSSPAPLFVPTLWAWQGPPPQGSLDPWSSKTFQEALCVRRSIPCCSTETRGGAGWGEWQEPTSLSSWSVWDDTRLELPSRSPPLSIRKAASEPQEKTGSYFIITGQDFPEKLNQ